MSPSPSTAKKPRAKKSSISLLESNGIVSLSDGATASDALDSEIAAQLGPVPELPEPPRAPGHSHGPKAAPKAGKRSGKSAPLASELVEPLKGSLGLITFGLGLLLCGMRLDDPLVQVVTMDADEAQAIAEPLANILARQKWFTQYGRSLVNADDTIALVFAVLMYSGRVLPAISEHVQTRPARERHRQQARRVHPAQPQQAAPAPAGASPSANGYDPAFEFPGQLAADWN